MKITEIFDSSANNETWNLDDGTYTGKISEFKTVSKNQKFLIKIEIDSAKTFVNMTYNNQYSISIYRKLFSSCDDTDELIGRKVKFTVYNKSGNNGVKYTNISGISLIEDSSSEKTAEEADMNQLLLDCIVGNCEEIILN